MIKIIYQLLIGYYMKILNILLMLVILMVIDAENNTTSATSSANNVDAPKVVSHNNQSQGIQQSRTQAAKQIQTAKDKPLYEVQNLSKKKEQPQIHVSPSVHSEPQKDKIVEQPHPEDKQKQQVKVNLQRIHQDEQQIEHENMDIEHIQQKIDEMEELQMQDQQIVEPMNQQEQNQEKLIEEQEREIEKQQEQELEQQLASWIQQQREENKKIQPENQLQRFEFMFKNDQLASFSFDASYVKPGKFIYIHIMVFIDENDVLTIPNHVQQENYVELNISQTRYTPKSTARSNLETKKIYIESAFRFLISKAGKYYLNFRNKHYSNVAVIVGMEQLPTQLNSLQSHEIDPQANRLSKVVESIQATSADRKYAYKWQWGFKEKEDEHQSNLLALTGVELIAIITTSIVQMFFFRNLLDNRNIV